MISDYPFYSSIQANIKVMENLIRQQANDYDPNILSALDILMNSGGKRIRPMITLMVGHMLNAPIDRLISLAASIELLHTATLVHDDLIDGAMLRRGTPTLNSKWSASATVLTGDFLFASAAKLAADTNSVAVMKLFARTLMIIVNGEITQQLSSKCELDHSNYMKRIYSKTASLFEAATTTAALLGQGENKYLDDIQNFGRNIGISFQIIDDILDFTSETSTIGKPVGSDLRQGLVTLPVLYYADIHPEDEDLISFLDGTCLDDPRHVERLVTAIRNSPAIDRSKQEAKSFLDQGLSKLHNLPECGFRNGLEDLAITIVERNL